MVMRTRDGILHTEPTETYRDNGGGGTLPAVATDTMDPESSAAWNDWWRRCWEPERLAMCDGIAEATATGGSSSSAA
jgi:hypothetical protein